jgi:hypothetical protein
LYHLVFELTPKETVLGLFSDESSLQKIVPYLFLVARNYIHRCKWTDTKPVFNIFKIKVKQKEKIENINALVENEMYKHDNKWWSKCNGQKKKKTNNEQPHIEQKTKD